MLEGKRLKNYKGFMIEKSWKVSESTGKKIDIIYTAYTEDGSGLFDGATTLVELKKKIDACLEKRIFYKKNGRKGHVKSE